MAEEFTVLTFRFMLGLLFVLAGLTKVANPRFRSIVRSYGLLPDGLVSPVARWLPWFEISCGGALTLGLFTGTAAATAALALVAFAISATLVLLSGKEVDCGCFGAAHRAKISWRTVVRNCCLAAMATTVAIRTPAALSVLPLGWGVPPTALRSSDAVASAVVASVLLLLALTVREAFALKSAVDTAAKATGMRAL